MENLKKRVWQGRESYLVEATRGIIGVDLEIVGARGGSKAKEYLRPYAATELGLALLEAGSLSIDPNLDGRVEHLVTGIPERFEGWLPEIGLARLREHIPGIRAVVVVIDLNENQSDRKHNPWDHYHTMMFDSKVEGR